MRILEDNFDLTTKVTKSTKFADLKLFKTFVSFVRFMVHSSREFKNKD
jgi:hypothetical protein